MLELSASLINQPVLSLRTGAPVATTQLPIINPANLKIEGFYCEDYFDTKQQLVLLAQDVRERVNNAFVIDDHEVLADPEELVRLQSVLKINFALTGKPVYTDKKKRLGKVADYALDGNALYIQKLYVSQSIIKSISNAQLTVDRSQIVEVSDTKVMIKDPLQGVKEANPAPAIA